MVESKNFDLMKNKPLLNRDTLNYVWDVLWRLNATTECTNSDKRIRVNERERIMNYMQQLANE